MISTKTLKSLEYDKVLSALKEYAVLDNTKNYINNFVPFTTFEDAKLSLDKTNEAFNLLFNNNVCGMFFADNIEDFIPRLKIGGVLNCGELLKISNNLKSARIIKNSILAVNSDEFIHIPQIASRLFVDNDLEKEITDKIISPDEISDNASPKLYSLRKKIRDINASIRDKLNSYIRGNSNNYLQDAVVTVRQDRYVIPVKSEFRSKIKGFIHDQSSSGATVFIEPEVVMELNNELKKAKFDEADEIYKILFDLSAKISVISDLLLYNLQNLTEIDFYYTLATYSFKNKCTKPNLNNNGLINIKRGRHPLISKEKVVPVSVNLGKDFNFLLVSGPNTGGKTVTMKLIGLFSLMAMSGLFIPADDESDISFFNGVYCDIGDEQSIEQDLSTFSSHMKNIIEITKVVNDSSLVLLDELGGGTDPDEGSALALAIIEKLLSLNCFGVITTHYSKLKEFAIESNKIENACMEFDSKTLKPLYKINIGIPGSSNAFEIATNLGLEKDIISKATTYVSKDKIGFEKVLKKANESRIEAENLINELEKQKVEREIELSTIKLEREKIVKERERIYFNAKQETKRIVADKLDEAEEIIDELKDILRRADLESKEIIKASELKNRLKNSRYLQDNLDEPIELIKATEKDIKVGNSVYVKSLGTKGKILSVKKNKGEAEVLIGNIKSMIKFNDIFNSEKEANFNKDKNVKIFKKSINYSPKLELNVIGKTSLEALTEVKNFIDSAVVNNIEEIKIIHGVGEGILLKSIREYLKTDKNVLEFRKGKFGEGENGVTIIKMR